MDGVEKFVAVGVAITVLSISFAMITLAIWLIGGMAGWWTVE